METGDESVVASPAEAVRAGVRGASSRRAGEQAEPEEMASRRCDIRRRQPSPDGKEAATRRKISAAPCS